MPLNNPAAYGLAPFNAANTLALGENIRGARTQNALEQLRLQREQNPNSMLNRGRELNLNAAEEAVRSAQLQNAIPALSSARQMLGAVRETIENKGATAGRQMLNRQLFTLKNQGVLPEDFDLGVDPGALSDEEFTQDVFQSEQDLASMLAGFQQPEDLRTSAAIGDMQRLGYPMTREGFQQYNQDRGSGTPEELEALIAEARLRGLLSEQERAQTQAEREEQERQQARRAQELSIERNLEQNMSAVDLTESLEGTMLESGAGLLPADARRGLAVLRQMVEGFVGRDTSELSQMIADFDTQRKTLQDQVNARISSGEYGRSATQLQSIERSLANPNISPAAIIRIQGQLGQIDLDRAEAQEIDVPNREEWERRVQEWKEYDPVSASIPQMSKEQIGQLDLESMSVSQLEAIDKRLDELD